MNEKKSCANCKWSRHVKGQWFRCNNARTMWDMVSEDKANECKRYEEITKQK